MEGKGETDLIDPVVPQALDEKDPSTKTKKEETRVAVVFLSSLNHVSFTRGATALPPYSRGAVRSPRLVTHSSKLMVLPNLEYRVALSSSIFVRTSPSSPSSLVTSSSTWSLSAVSLSSAVSSSMCTKTHP